jgi:hypothetical protein
MSLQLVDGVLVVDYGPGVGTLRMEPEAYEKRLIQQTERTLVVTALLTQLEQDVSLKESELLGRVGDTRFHESVNELLQSLTLRQKVAAELLELRNEVMTARRNLSAILNDLAQILPVGEYVRLRLSDGEWYVGIDTPFFSPQLVRVQKPEDAPVLKMQQSEAELP